MLSSWNVFGGSVYSVDRRGPLVMPLSCYQFWRHRGVQQTRTASIAFSQRSKKRFFTGIVVLNKVVQGNSLNQSIQFIMWTARREGLPDHGRSELFKSEFYSNEFGFLQPAFLIFGAKMLPRCNIQEASSHEDDWRVISDLPHFCAKFRIITQIANLHIYLKIYKYLIEQREVARILGIFDGRISKFV